MKIVVIDKFAVADENMLEVDPNDTILFFSENDFYRSHPKRKDGKWDMRYSINHEEPWRKFNPTYDR